jgi:hypothetical protein
MGSASNRVARSFLLLAPTPPTVRVRSGRFTLLQGVGGLSPALAGYRSSLFAPCLINPVGLDHQAASFQDSVLSCVWPFMAFALVGLGFTTMAAADFCTITARIAEGRAVLVDDVAASFFDT